MDCFEIVPQQSRRISDTGRYLTRWSGRKLAETKIGLLAYANGRLGGTVVTITLLFIFIMILLTVRLPTHLEKTKSVCAIIYLYVNRLYYASNGERSEQNNK
jgi:hypothetical protein